MKNNRIQFWRIVFTYLIALYHFNNAYGVRTSWYIGVEFFFVLSGYLLVKKSEISNESALRYTFNKVKKFFPHCLFAFLIAFGGYGVLKGYTLKEWGIGFINCLDEVFLIQSIGLNYATSSKMNGVTWYISVLLIAGYFMWFMLKHHRKIYVEIMAPFLVLFIYAYLYRTYGNLNEHGETVGFLLNSAMMRGTAAMNCGVIAYYLSNYVVALEKNDRARKTLLIVSDICFCVVILSSAITYRSVYDYLYIVFLTIGISFGFTDDKKRWYFDNRVVDFLASICLSIYLNHKVFRVIFEMLFFKEISIIAYIVYIIVITVYSICTYFFINKIVKLGTRWWTKLFILKK